MWKRLTVRGAGQHAPVGRRGYRGEQTSPAPLIIALVAGAAVFQFFLRYETFTGGQDGRTLYERDRLTGNVKVLDGSRADWGGDPSGAARLSADRSAATETASDPGRDRLPLRRLAAEGSVDGPIDTRAVAQPAPRRVPTLAAIPLPPADLAEPEEAAVRSPIPLRQSAPTPAPTPKPPAVARALPAIRPASGQDLNGDGEPEDVIQTRSPEAPDGLTDYSIVVDGREVFYGRGSRLKVLRSRSNGWSDIQMVTGAGTAAIQSTYTYNPSTQSYEPTSG